MHDATVWVHGQATIFTGVYQRASVSPEIGLAPNNPASYRVQAAITLCRLSRRTNHERAAISATRNTERGRNIDRMRRLLYAWDPRIAEWGSALDPRHGAYYHVTRNLL